MSKQSPEKKAAWMFAGGLIFLVALWIFVFRWGVQLVRYLQNQ